MHSIAKYTSCIVYPTNCVKVHTEASKIHVATTEFMQNLLASFYMKFTNCKHSFFDTVM